MTRDADIGKNMARERERAAVSQQALADHMRGRGWKWSQATVWSVEKGDRPLRLAEAADVSAILGLDGADVLLGQATDAALTDALVTHRTALLALMHAAEEYDAARALVYTAASNAAHEGRLTEIPVNAIGTTPESVIANAREIDARRKDRKMMPDDVGRLIDQLKMLSDRG